jgi:hypothetical protein
MLTYADVCWQMNVVLKLADIKWRAAKNDYFAGGNGWEYREHCQSREHFKLSRKHFADIGRWTVKPSSLVVFERVVIWGWCVAWQDSRRLVLGRGQSYRNVCAWRRKLVGLLHPWVLARHHSLSFSLSPSPCLPPPLPFSLNINLSQSVCRSLYLSLSLSHMHTVAYIHAYISHTWLHVYRYEDFTTTWSVYNGLVWWAHLIVCV